MINNAAVTVRNGAYVLPPAVVQDIGHGSLKAGEKVLDHFVQKVRNEAGRKMLPRNGKVPACFAAFVRDAVGNSSLTLVRKMRRLAIRIFPTW